MLGVAFYTVNTHKELSLEEYHDMIHKQFVQKFNSEVVYASPQSKIRVINLDIKALARQTTSGVTYLCEIYYETV